ncbi:MULTISPECIES: hypothetical protein [Microbacterium]|uniref:Uncharacterized protein n=2 Tax=Microbacterium maritypicum TaxID=33918 RepID=A0AAJ5VB31_MICMQ|nr:MULTISPECIES: hypothetical protein [Microbacterium]MBP5803644.1 hypothetical protein [Microbacterium liquefaciens]UTT52896.1 hypothetical protein NMQ05_17725 [Microbacterium liquefaciens]WEF20988.1 hypothetical protein PWF71_17125 [Microbacterium liquefaciens]
MATTSRPAGVTFVAVLAWISAVLQIVLSILILTGVLAVSSVSIPSTWFALVIGFVTLLVSFGLFGGRNIARVIVTVSLVLSIVGAVLQAIVHQDANVLVGSLITVVLALVGIVMLYTARANSFFS